MASTVPEVTPRSLPALPPPESVGGRLAGADERAHMDCGAAAVLEMLWSRRNRALADVSLARPCALGSTATGVENTLAGETL